jgi:hypothetical protein
MFGLMTNLEKESETKNYISINSLIRKRGVVIIDAPSHEGTCTSGIVSFRLVDITPGFDR